MLRLVVHPAAEREVQQALAWTRRDFGAAAARRLRSDIEAAGQLLLRHPLVGTEDEAGARRLPLRRFPYTLVYQCSPSIVHVLALAHQSRMPDYWQGRS